MSISLTQFDYKKLFKKSILAVIIAIMLLIIGLPSIAFYYENVGNSSVAISDGGTDNSPAIGISGNTTFYSIGIGGVTPSTGDPVSTLLNLLPLIIAVGGVIGILAMIITKDFRAALMIAVTCIAVFVIVQFLLTLI